MQESRSGEFPGREPEVHAHDEDPARDQKYSLRLGLTELQLLLDSVIREKQHLEYELASPKARGPRQAIDLDNARARLRECDVVIDKLTATTIE